MIGSGVGFQIKTADAAAKSRLVMSETKRVILDYVDVLRIDCGNVCCGNAARDVVICERVVREVILLES